MTDALLVNPRDPRAVADAVHRALTMPLDERRTRHERLMQVLRRNDIHAWHGRFVQQLLACATPDVVSPAAVAIGRTGTGR
jgi:trehalose 6-phosphate synthase